MRKTPKIDAYIQEVFDTYDDWMPVATIHSHILNYMQEDGIHFLFLPPIELIFQRVSTLIDKNILEWKNLSTHGGMCIMVRIMRR